MSRHEAKLMNFTHALDRLREGALIWRGSGDLGRDGLIQRFEFTFELAWKTLKSCFEEEGLLGLTSPKTVLREAFSAGLIVDEELWLAMLVDRNSTVHIYSEPLAVQICQRIETNYVGAFEILLEKIRVRLGFPRE